MHKKLLALETKVDLIYFRYLQEKRKKIEKELDLLGDWIAYKIFSDPNQNQVEAKKLSDRGATNMNLSFFDRMNSRGYSYGRNEPLVLLGGGEAPKTLLRVWKLSARLAQIANRKSKIEDLIRKNRELKSALEAKNNMHQNVDTAAKVTAMAVAGSGLFYLSQRETDAHQINELQRRKLELEIESLRRKESEYSKELKKLRDANEENHQLLIRIKEELDDQDTKTQRELEWEESCKIL